MARVKMTGQGELVPYTDAEEAEADARDEATAAAKTAADAAAPMNAWLAAMAETDSFMSRVVDVPPTAHEKWVKAYKEELGEEVIVDLIREVRALSAEARTPQFEKLVTTVDAIDARFPD